MVRNYLRTCDTFDDDNLNKFFFLAKVLSFNHLMEMLSDSQLSIDKVLRNLALCGVMLRGNWALQSEVLYPPGFVSLINGVSSELMCRGRDYVLFKLMKNELSFLNRQKISVLTQLPQEETKEVIESIAYLKVTEKKSKIWDLLKPADYDFEKRHPEIVQRQEAFWKAQELKFLEMEAEKSEKRTRKKSVREAKV
jgi:DNA-directed RNA polymerase III subunit RPC5